MIVKQKIWCVYMCILASSEMAWIDTSLGRLSKCMSTLASDRCPISGVVPKLLRPCPLTTMGKYSCSSK